MVLGMAMLWGHAACPVRRGMGTGRRIEMHPALVQSWSRRSRSPWPQFKIRRRRGGPPAKRQGGSVAGRRSSIGFPRNRPAPGVREPGKDRKSISNPKEVCSVAEWSVRLPWTKISPEAYQAMAGLQRVVNESTLPPRLIHLIEIRASQMNGCAYCLDMHTKDSRALGESEQRIYGLSAWRESPFYNREERAALAWTEVLTHVAGGVPDGVYEEMRACFSPEEVVALTATVVTINAWNRWMIGMRIEPGTYRPDLAR
jgi:AhpD family alkylhydroperoxidase